MAVMTFLGVGATLEDVTSFTEGRTPSVSINNLGGKTVVICHSDESGSLSDTVSSEELLLCCYPAAARRAGHKTIVSWSGKTRVGFRQEADAIRVIFWEQKGD